MSHLEDRRTLFHGIKQTAISLKDSCAGSFPPPISNATATLPSVHFTLPEALPFEQLIPGLDPRLAGQLAQSYASRVKEVQVVTEDLLHRACSDLTRVPPHSRLMPLPLLLSRVVAAYMAHHQRAIKALEKSVIASVSRIQPNQTPRKASIPSQRPAFNHEFTPFLQKYFEYNAYPSVADRAQMAKKSLMEPRQIEVWFQNHRRRAKAEGKTLRRTSASDTAPYDMCLKIMEEKMELFLIPEPLRQSVDTDVSDAGSDDEEDDEAFYNDGPEEMDTSDVLNPPPSRHAFPMPWSRGRNAPTAIRSTQLFSFPPPEWRRTPSVAPVNRPVVTMKELIQSFATCHVHDSTCVLSPPFKIATVVIPPPAPHPSLVRGKFHPPPVVATTSLNIVPALRIRQHPFRSPSPSAQLATLVPAPRKKKVAGPPRRTPKKAIQRTNSEKSTFRSPSPLSRTPSLESSDFSPSRTPSFGSTFISSRSSSASSGPATPVGSPAVHSLEILESTYLELFGDEDPSRRSASPGSFKFPMGEKQPFEFAFTG